MSSTGINGQYAKIWNTLDNQRMSTNVDDLSPATEYYFYLVATGLSGNYKSNTVQVTTAAKADDAEATLAASPHEIVIDSPNDHTVYNDSLTLNVTIKFLESDGLIYWQTLSTLNYSLDNNPPVDIITNAGLAQMGSPVNSNNVTISGLADGQHKIEVTAVLVANVGNVFMPTYVLTSNPTFFTVATVSTPATEPNFESIPWFPVVAVSVTVAIVVAAAGLVYWKKRKPLSAGVVKNP
jgi:hypothetical protein